MLCVGDDPASKIYSASIERAGGGAGISVEVVGLPGDAGTAAVARTLTDLAGDPRVDGIIVQQPLPAGVEETALAVVPTTPEPEFYALAMLAGLAAWWARRRRRNAQVPAPVRHG